MFTMLVLIGIASTTAFASIAPEKEPGSASYPISCKEILDQDSNAMDGNYTILSDGHLISVYCSNMSTTPAEYLSLNHTEGSYNFSRFAAGGNYQGTDAVTHYNKVRFNPFLVQISSTDRSFSISKGTVTYNGQLVANNMNYGNAAACVSPWNPAGTANMDLTGTILSFSPNQFKTDGWNPAGTINYSANNQVVNLTGGGWCGGTGPISSDGSIQLEWQYQSLEILASSLNEDNQSTITASLKDVNENPVANQTITFTSTKGLISANAQTDENGVATVILNLPGYETAHIEAVSSIGGSFGMTSVVRPDLIAPVTTDNASENWSNEDVTITLDATDVGNGVENTFYQVNDGIQQSGNTVLFTEEGTHVLTYWSEDKAGNVEEKKSVTVKIDKTAPTIQVTLDQTKLWSPNHKLVDINAAVEANDGASNIDSIVLLSIKSNEADSNLDSDDQANDIQDAEYGTQDVSFKLRAERFGKGEGRVYTITYKVTDLAGNETLAVVYVKVPHDKGRGKK